MLVYLTIMVKSSKITLHVLDVWFPVHETVKSLHWVRFPTATLDVCTTERKEVIYVHKQRRSNFRMVEVRMVDERRDESDNIQVNCPVLVVRICDHVQRRMLRSCLADSGREFVVSVRALAALA